MADYIIDTGGSNGQMMIRDDGYTVSFWAKSGPYTYNYDLPWRYVINGVDSGWIQFRFERTGDWQLFGQWGVTDTQTVLFHLGNSTVALGGPVEFYQFIQRATVPPPPSMFYITNVWDTYVDGYFVGQGDGGSGILEWQIGYGRDPNGLQYLVGSGGTSRIGGLSPGDIWYFWTRGRNALGWSAFSARSSAQLYRVPDAPNPVVLTNVRQTAVHAEFAGNGDGFTPVLEWQIGYGLSSSYPTNFVSQYNLDVGNLDPGKTYFFWARGRNAIGWGPWSAVRYVTLVAGAYVTVGSSTKRAVPYVRVSGVWKVARPMIKDVGVWKESQ